MTARHKRWIAPKNAFYNFKIFLVDCQPGQLDSDHSRVSELFDSTQPCSSFGTEYKRLELDSQMVVKGGFLKKFIKRLKEWS